MKIFILMNSLMKKHIPFVFLSIIVGVFTIVSNVGMLATSSVLISKAALHPGALDLMVLIVGVRFFSISRGVFRYIERIVSHNTTFKILSSLRRWFYKSFDENYSENIKEFKTGEIYTKLINDVDSLKEYFLRVIYPLIIAILTGIITTIFICFFNAKLSVIYLAFYILSGFLLPAMIFKLNNTLMEKEAHLKKEINLYFLDTLKGITEISVFGLGDKIIHKYNSLRKEFSVIQEKKNKINLLGDNIYGFSVTLLMAIALFEIAPLIYSDSFSGVYYAMLPLAIMASFEALLPMPMLFHKNNEAFIAGKNIFPIIEEKSNRVVNNKEITSRDISVRNIYINKPDSNEYILEDISFELPIGKKLAIVGSSGSGKSTILKVILGFMDYTKGSIKIGNLEHSSIDVEEIRKNFTYVEQNPYVFNASIKDNLMLANSNVEEAVPMRVLADVKIKKLVCEMPYGINSLIGQFGSKISGGEKQRLAIARALLKSAPVVLLDEPTASLDVELEREIIDELHSFIKNKSCIWVTHRLIAMEKMDEIILLDRGKIAERGTHKQLLELKGKYYNLWRIQQQFIENSNN